MDKQRVQKVLDYALTCTRSTGSEESQQTAVSTGNDSNAPSENGSEVYVFTDNTRREISNELVRSFLDLTFQSWQQLIQEHPEVKFMWISN